MQKFIDLQFRHLSQFGELEKSFRSLFDQLVVPRNFRIYQSDIALINSKITNYKCTGIRKHER